MPDLLEHMYCAQQINIPPNLPYILKQYAKAAIRTQPYDLLFWSAAYFRAKADNLPPPVKERLEYPPFDSPSRLSPGFLRVLHKQLGSQEYVRVEILYEKWLGVCLVKDALDSMLKIGQIQDRVPWLKFMAIAAGHICTSLGKTMVLLCEVLTDQPDGGAAWIPVDKFVELYQFLAHLDCGPMPPYVKKVEIMQDSASDTTTQASTVVIEEKVEDKVKVLEEKDSTTGLMVWPDVKPQEKPDRVQSPKAEDEPGASSELGVEVYDTAKGPVKEVVTLYSATTKSAISGQSESPEKIGMMPEDVQASSKLGTKLEKSETVGENVLSHSSLKENEDWIKIQAKNLDEGGKGSGPLDLDELLDSAGPSKSDAKDKTVSKEGGKSEKEGDEKIGGQENVVEGSDDQHEQEVKTTRNEEIQKPDEMSEKESENGNKTEGESKSYGVEGDELSLASVASQENTGEQPIKVSLDSEDSDYAVHQSITMTNFARTRQIGYSVVEIRKGRVGDKSLDNIYSDEGPMASATVHRLTAPSEDSIETEEEPKLPHWLYVPGIGPVIPQTQVLAVVEYMQYWASKQHGLVGPRNINHLLCPPLDLPPTPQDEEGSKY